MPTTVAVLAQSAARVFRGHCARARTSTIIVGGARLAATTYTFAVREHLKGSRRRRVTFRQVGAPGGGPRDLGGLVGLPTYVPGTEYVLFLLPRGSAGLTSPAGAAEGAFIVREGNVRPLRGGRVAGAGLRTASPSAESSAPETLSYEALRRAVREALVR